MKEIEHNSKKIENYIMLIGLEESKLLKCSYYPKQSTHSSQFPSE